MRVLLAEDSDVTRHLVSELVRKAGHECVTAADGIAAWELFCEGGADVVLADWMMPGIDGDELCRRIRAADSPYVYFVLFTALSGKGYLREAMQAGADDYVTKPFEPEELYARLIAAERVTSAYRKLDAQTEELQRLNAELHEQARLDPLTGLGNRLRLADELAALDARAERYGQNYAVAMGDIDRFKDYNDALGHAAGDAALRSVANALVSSSRGLDSAYRYGGEELLVIFPELEIGDAPVAAERLRASVEALAIDRPGDGGVLTISIGVAARLDGESGEDAIKRADAALYEAKAAGRNRVAVA